MSMLPETLEIGRDVVEFVKPYFELFREDGFAPALSLGLLVLAAAFAVSFLLRYVLPIRWVLWRQGPSHSPYQRLPRFCRTIRCDRRITVEARATTPRMARVQGNSDPA